MRNAEKSVYFHVFLFCITGFILNTVVGCQKPPEPKKKIDWFSPEAQEIQKALNSDDGPATKKWLSQGWDPDQPLVDGSTLLHAAAGMGYLDVVNALLDGGANPNIVNPQKESPLHKTIFYNTTAQPKIVSALLKAGCDPNIKDADGRTAIDYALVDNNQACVALLPKESATISLPLKELSTVKGVSITRCPVKRSDSYMRCDSKSMEIEAKACELSYVLLRCYPSKVDFSADTEIPEALYNIKIQAKDGQTVWALLKAACEQDLGLQVQENKELTEVLVLKKIEDAPRGLVEVNEKNNIGGTANTPGGFGYKYQSCSMERLAEVLSRYTDKKILDETGLTKFYKFTLAMDHWHPETMYSAVEKLGLTLSKEKRDIPTLRVFPATKSSSAPAESKNSK